MSDTWITLGGWLVLTIWLLLLLPTIVVMLLRTLPRKTDQLPAPDIWPKLSVIVPARDEEPHIEAALRSLLANDYPALELIAVNDRSTDGTGDIMDRLAVEDDRLRIIHIEQLPSGWLGKNHALEQAALQAEGEYILFTDGDVVFADDTLRRSVNYARREEIDHLCLMPRLVTGGYWESALTTYFGFVMTSGVFIWLIPTPFKWAYAGVGAFNLVRAETYRAAGGHEPIRLDVLDDVKLGKLMKRAGRSDILLADRAVAVRWQPSAIGVIRGLEKNAFAAVEYSLFRLIALTLFWAAMSLLPYAAVLALPGLPSLGYTLAMLFVHTSYAVMGRRLGGTLLVLPVLPVAGLLIVAAFWRSAWITLRQQGVKWRDTFYPLDELRKGMYR